MKQKHAEIRLRIIHAVLSMAEEDALVIVDTAKGDPEAYKEAVKSYNRAVRAKQYFYDLFTQPCHGDCGGCPGCGEEEE